MSKAMAVPSSGASVRWATRIQSESALKEIVLPPATVTSDFPKKTIAASTTIAALTKKAIVSATVESIVLKRIALRTDASSRCNLRDCTRAE